jgi:hypothetical protein
LDVGEKKNDWLLREKRSKKAAQSALIKGKD